MTLRPGESLTSASALLEIDPGLPPGRYVFQLAVTDDRGRRSEPTTFTVTIEPGPPRPGP